VINHRIVFFILCCALAACDRGAPTEQKAAPAVAAPQTATPFTEPAKQAAATIDGKLIHATVAEIASDAYEGRLPGSDGDRKARAWIAGALKQVGFEPGGADGSWEQPFELVGIDSKPPATWTLSGPKGKLDLKVGEDFVAFSGVQNERAELKDAGVVFVGYGIVAPEYGWDDFKGVDLKGKVLLMLNNDPDWDPALFEGNRRLYYGRWTYKYESAARRGAAGAIIIHTDPSAGYPWQVVQSSFSGEQFELPAGDEPRVQVAAWMTAQSAAKLAELGGTTLEALLAAAREKTFQPVPLDVRTSIALQVKLRSTQSANVLGLLKGGDPSLAGQAVVFIAHHDHLGVGEPNPAVDPEDRIYNGAMDNASGVGMVLEVARAFAALPERPKRSVLVAMVGAEEQGLVGSEYFALHPSLARRDLAAGFNLDSGNIHGRTRDIVVIGKGKSSLDELAEQVARFQQREIKPDQFPDKGYFYRSDQFSFARVGVPAIGLDSGTDFLGRDPDWGRKQVEAYTARDYHQPSDELTPEWNFEGMVEDAQFAFWLGLLVANANEPPRWNKGDEFEALRLADQARPGSPASSP